MLPAVACDLLWEMGCCSPWLDTQVLTAHSHAHSPPHDTHTLLQVRTRTQLFPAICSNAWFSWLYNIPRLFKSRLELY